MTRSPNTHPGQPVEVLIKADEILQLLSERPDMTVAQIAEGVGEPRSSVYRLIAALDEMGFVEPAPRGKGHHLGLRLFTLGNLVGSQLSIIQVAHPEMERLFERTGETIFLLVRDGYKALCVARLGGAQVQSMAVATGGTLPLHLGAAPMVLLAHEDPEFAEEYVRTAELSTRTKRSIVTPDAILERLPAIREQGYAISDEDLVMGIAAVGAPVRDARGRVRAGLSMSGARPTLLGDNTEATISLVGEAARAIVAPDE